jgi:phosphoglycolate phosphatase
VSDVLLVFDLDGTLIDSQRDLAAATNRLVAELGGRQLAEDAVAAMVGEGAAVLVRRALAAAGVQADERGALARFLEIYESALLVHTRPYDGMVATLERLASAARLAILTNKPARATNEILDGLDLRRYFADVIGGDTTFARKPNPAGLNDLIARAGVQPSAAMLIGDSPIDHATARRADTAVCLARYGFGYRFGNGEFTGSELFINAPEELVGVVSDWLAEGGALRRSGQA